MTGSEAASERRRYFVNRDWDNAIAPNDYSMAGNSAHRVTCKNCRRPLDDCLNYPCQRRLARWEESGL
jgi:hypothetical protein